MTQNKSSGFSLIETMVALGLFSAVLALYIFVMGEVSRGLSVNRTQSEASAEMSQMIQTLRLYLSHASQMQLYPDNLNGCCANPFGGIITYSNAAHLENELGGLLGASPNIDSHPQGLTQEVRPLILFKTETTRSAATPSAVTGGLASEGGAGGLFYQRALPKSFGVLHLHINTNGPQVSPQQAQFSWTHLVDFEIFDIITVLDPLTSSPIHIDRLPGGRPLVAAASFRVVRRIFKGGGDFHYQNASWCPPSLMGRSGCTSGLNWEDVEHEFTITFKNTPMNMSLTNYRMARIFENVFFFQPVYW